MSITAERIKSLRKQKHLTQSELANIINASRMAIANYETDRNKPSFAMLSLIAGALNTNISYLMGSTENSNPNLSFQERLMADTPIIVDVNGNEKHNTYELLDELTDQEIKEVDNFIQFLKFKRNNNDTSSN